MGRGKSQPYFWQFSDLNFCPHVADSTETKKQRTYSRRVLTARVNTRKLVECCSCKTLTKAYNVFDLTDASSTLLSLKAP